MDNLSLSFLRDKFANYYRSNRIDLPYRFGKREFAFMPFGAKLMRRHISFKRKDDFARFVSRTVPAHIYYSSAFYQHPDAPTMEEKGWMGAELIFDLDLDHLEKRRVSSYEEGLQIVKEEFKRLVEDFLIRDFGFNESNLKLYFSGGRGFHCHVVDSRVFQLDSSERREIVDYITGNDIEENIVFMEMGGDTLHIIEEDLKRRGIDKIKSVEGGVRSERTRVRAYLKIPKDTEPGWKGRIGKAIINIVQNISDDNFKRYLTDMGISEKDIKRLERELTPKRVKGITEYGIIEQSRFIRKFFLDAATKRAAISSMTGETDEPVTCDIKRLIRLPGSLHGKTGLKVCEIGLDSLDDFDPLYDAVVFSDEKIGVDVLSPMRISMKGEVFDLTRGSCKVPEYLAVFLVGRGIAKIINRQ